ncbi:FtsX-like permease family protein [Aurantimonas endophytica]|uniref:Putative ABC transport system permease protein n=1 Tax=Aurantimonas endophytica TaxID=1522175 RepID=A0A7W6HGA1_9HYPH|nr:FtsX-like permease family protein [Aurantimonas endophytica]MBB4004597.1 putative ABC transport system permease protein [Aurantimonas endophytica]MCO6405433.1 FtsX-like permease family protein [Aurantimonas endophytica]
MTTRTDLVFARLALRWLILGDARADPARFLGTMIAIAVGVALGFAIHLINGSALASFDGAVRSVNGAADLQVRAASPLGFDELLYPRIIDTPGVGDASPVVALDAQAGEARFTLLGLDILRAANVTPSLVGEQMSGPDTGSANVFDESALFVSRAVLDATGGTVGETRAVSANGRSVELVIAGILPAVADGQAIAVMDIAAAQWRFDRLGRLDRVDLSLADRGAAERSLSQWLPGDVVLGSDESELAQGSALSRAYRLNLDMLALVALVTGGFLVFSAQSLSVARRLRAFALVRTLGLPRRGIVAVVALEGLAIGIVGALLGLALGAALATFALRWFGGDLGAGYFRGGDVRIVFQPLAAAVFFALGIAAAMLGSVLPARAASQAAPAAALKNSGDMLDPRSAVPLLPALVLIAAGSLAALLPPVGGLPVFGFVGMALLLAGGVAGVPWLARRLLAPLAVRRTTSVPGLLAVRHVHGAPAEAATALCGIVASTALVIAMATMVTSFRGAVDEWLVEVLSSDLYLRAEGSAGFDPSLQARLAGVPGVAGLSFSRQIPLTLIPDRPPVALIARSLDGQNPEASLVLIEEAAAQVGSIPVWVSEPAARLYGWSVGDAVDLPIGAGEAFTVSGIWRDYSRQQGALVIRDKDYTRLTGDAERDEAAVTIDPGADPDAVGRTLLEALPAELRSSVSIAQPATLRRFALELFDRSFAVTYVLQAVAILVGLAGVAATMSSQTIARVREFGMLAHLGVEKRQIMAMLGIEGALLGTIGGVAGVLLGGALSQILIHVINPQSFNWTMATIVPVGTIAAVFAALVFAASVTAMLAGRRATATNAALAVREDW